MTYTDDDHDDPPEFPYGEFDDGRHWREPAEDPWQGRVLADGSRYIPDDEPPDQHAADYVATLDYMECMDELLICWAADEIDDVDDANTMIWRNELEYALALRLSEIDICMVEIGLAIILAGTTHYASGAPFPTPLARL